MILPFLFHVAMGILMFYDETVMPYVGIGIFTLGWMSYSLFIALGHWKNSFVI